MVSIHTIMSTTTVRNPVSSRVTTFPDMACVFSGSVAPGVAEVGFVFPRVRASICESCRMRLYTARELDLHLKWQKKITESEHFWKMKLEKCIYSSIL